MKKNLFEMGSNFNNEWSSDNKRKEKKKEIIELKPADKHQLYFTKEKRRGKVVTIVKPFYLEKKELQLLLKTLKKSLGTGGTLKDNSLEFQGDIVKNLKEQLENLKYRFKRG